MLKTNPLTKPITSVSLAIGVATVASLGSSILVAPSAQASGYSGWANGIFGTNVQPVKIGDKIFSEFTDLTSNVFLSTNYLTIGGNGRSWSVDLSFNPFPTPPQSSGVGPFSLPETYTYSYKIRIDPAINANATFDRVHFDTLVNTLDGSVSGTKTILTDTNQKIVLNSFDGGSAFISLGPNVKSIMVTDSISVSGVLKGVTNSYTQREVPEPGTVLGILAVGGIGFISRFRKQK